MEFRDYYKVLGVDKKASAADIKKAFRALARESHPDLHAGDEGAEARFKAINEAYEVLGDADKRRKYDDLGSNWRQYEQAARTGQEPAQGAWSVNYGGGPGGARYRTMNPEEMRGIFGSDDPFSDFFHTFFGGQAGAPGREPQRPSNVRGRDLEHRVDLNLEEAFTGTTRQLRIAGGGREETVDVRIPAGVTDRAKVRVAGKGGSGQGSGPSGDLFLRIRILPHSRFERRGRDLHVRMPIKVTTAVLGGEVPVQSVAGTTLRLTVPPLTTSGRVFRLKGHGMPAVSKPESRGDLFATVDIQIPAQLSDDERAHYEALKALEGTS